MFTCEKCGRQWKYEVWSGEDVICECGTKYHIATQEKILERLELQRKIRSDSNWRDHFGKWLVRNDLSNLSKHEKENPDE